MLTQTFVGRRAYQDLARYTVDQDPCCIDLRDNTNLWGVPPGALDAIGEVAASACRYPRPYASELQRVLADYVSVDPRMVVTGCGSDDVIDASFRALADPGDRIGLLVPTFSSALPYARMNALTPLSCALTADWDRNVDALLNLDARLIYLCSPNNPTGGLMPRAAIARLLERTDRVVIIDEAYAEYAGVSSCALLERFEHLLVVRTLSKAFGLAGLRIGYAIGHPHVVGEVEKARGPYKVNRVAERAALAALTVDRTWVDDRVRETIANRERLATALHERRLDSLPSQANFLCCPTARARALAADLALQGIGVRLFTDLPGLGDAVRITIGPWPLMQAVLDGLGHSSAQRRRGGAGQ